MEKSLINEPIVIAVTQEHNGKMLKNTTTAASAVAKGESSSSSSLWACSNSNNNNHAECSSEATTIATTTSDEKQQQQQQRWTRKVSKPLKAFCEVVGVGGTTNCNNKAKIATPNTACPTAVVGGRASVQSQTLAGSGGGGDNGCSSGDGGEDEKKTTQNLQHNGGTSSENSKPISNKTSAYVVDICGVSNGGGSEGGIGISRGNSSTIKMWPRSNAMPTTAAAAVALCDRAACDNDCYATEATAASAMVGAVSLTPPDDNTHSNCTSINNSTDNLSYSSDNYYADDLILLDDEDIHGGDYVGNRDGDDGDGEEISLNSDDCVYAYRGDGAEYGNDCDVFTNRISCDVGGGGVIDDETDFLEMDFEPDPLSEIEFGFMEMSSSQADATAASETFLLQRDSCHLSGRHSVSLQPVVSPIPRQLFSSPIDDMPAMQQQQQQQPSKAALQSQAMLSKHFARISLHLDQIKGEASSECDYEMRTRNDGLSVMGGGGREMIDCVDHMPANQAAAQSTAHSLPSTLHNSFGSGGDGGDNSEEKEPKASPTKITGAKPKRLSTFSTSSSTSSKNSSKSRSSLRSAYAPPLGGGGGSSSFDERSVSCTEFTSSLSAASAIHGPHAPPTSAASNEDCLLNSVSSVGGGCDDFYGTEDFCLDCLEKEFLASTIGKAMEPNECARCRRRTLGGTLSGVGGNSLQRAYMLGRSTECTTTRCCRSGSPTTSSSSSSFHMQVRDDLLYGNDATTTQAFVQTHRHSKRVNWLSANSGPAKCKGRSEGLTKGRAAEDLRRLNWNESCVGDNRTAAVAAIEMNQRRSTTCDNYNSEHLLKNFVLTEPEIVTISTVNLTEETLVQALEKLHITYNIELLQAYFATHHQHNCLPANSNATTIAATSSNRVYKSIKHLLLHESKKCCNHRKLMRLIEMATGQQLNVQFKKDMSVARTEMVAVNVADILHQWTRTSNLELLKQLDKRFVQANVLGKVANIIRQAQQQRGNTTRRALPELIYIPQYYASGFLTLIKKI